MNTHLGLSLLFPASSFQAPSAKGEAGLRSLSLALTACDRLHQLSKIPSVWQMQEV